MSDERGRSLAEAVTGPLPRRDVRVKVGELELHAIVWGEDDAPPVLLVHGNGAHAHWWDPLIAGLCRGRRAIAVDLRGHGESDRPDAIAYSLEDQEADLNGLLDALGLETLPVIAHSMGGRIALWLATHHPERVSALAVLDTQLAALPAGATEAFRAKIRGRRDGTPYSSLDAALAAYRLVPDEPDAPPEVLGDIAYHAIEQCTPDEWRVRFDRGVLLGDGHGELWDQLERLHCPLRVAYAEQRGIIDAEVAELPRYLAGIEIARFPGGHHFFLSHPGPVLAWLEEELLGS